VKMGVFLGDLCAARGLSIYLEHVLRRLFVTGSVE